MASSYSHLALDQKVFDPASITPATHAFNQKLMDMMATGPKWYEVGAPMYRRMRAEGKTPIPAATYLSGARDTSVPSREPGRDIPCRVLRPSQESGVAVAVRGVFMHIHGGGWVLQDEKSQDPPLQQLADATGALVLSVGYRLAPEHPFPRGPEDCYDVAEWLVRHAEGEFGAPLSFIGGESAGGHLSVLAALHLLQHPDPVYSGFRLRGGLLCHFGAYDLTLGPSTRNFKKPVCLVLDLDLMVKYRAAFLPDIKDDDEALRDPKISPLFADLEALRGQLPSALFTCGTEDLLLDDTVFMSAKWMMAGAETVVKIVPGGAHGYIFYINAPESGYQEGMAATVEFMNSKLV